MTTTCVLLSGGLDSTAALAWTLATFERTPLAVAFDYGQPNRDCELAAASRAAIALQVPLDVVCLADAFCVAPLREALTHEPGPGLHRAFMPGRNLAMLALAAGRVASNTDERGPLSLVFGACLEDEGGFPDCTAEFVDLAQKCLSVALDRDVYIYTPWRGVSKSEILSTMVHFRPSVVEAVSRSWSCYRADGPCGECSPCVLRRNAFLEAGLVDLCERPVMRGGA